MKLKDYIFHILFMTYKNSYQAVNYLSIIDIILFSPIGFVFITSVGHFGKWATILAIGIYLALIFLLNTWRYENKRKIFQVIRKYHNNKYNKYIKKWMVYIFPFLFAFLYLYFVKIIADRLNSI